MLEFYWSYADFRDLMDLTEGMLRHIAESVLGNSKVTYQGSEYDFAQPFTRISVFDSILHYNPSITAEQLADEAGARAIAEGLGIPLKPYYGLGKVQIEIFEKTVEDRLDQPTFITQYPAEVSPLARRNDLDPFVTDRFEFFVGGREIANGFSELNDAVQREGKKGMVGKVKDIKYSGCTVTVVVVTPTRTLRVAWIGDCSCVAAIATGSDGGDVSPQGHGLPTGSKKLSSPDGRDSTRGSARGEGQGRRPRLLNAPHLAKQSAKGQLDQPVRTRAIGQRALESKGLTHEADEFVEPAVDLACLDFLVLGSSGLWKGVSQAQAIELVGSAGPGHAQHAAAFLTQTSQDCQFVSHRDTLGPAGVEDATAVVLWLASAGDT